MLLHGTILNATQIPTTTSRLVSQRTVKFLRPLLGIAPRPSTPIYPLVVTLLLGCKNHSLHFLHALMKSNAHWHLRKPLIQLGIVFNPSLNVPSASVSLLNSINTPICFYPSRMLTEILKLIFNPADRPRTRHLRHTLRLRGGGNYPDRKCLLRGQRWNWIICSCQRSVSLNSPSPSTHTLGLML